MASEPLKENSYIHTDEIVQGLQNLETENSSHERDINKNESRSKNHKALNSTVDDFIKEEEEPSNSRSLEDDNNILDSMKVETSLFYSSHSDQQSENEDISDHNEYMLDQNACLGQVDKEDHLKNSTSEEKNLEENNAKPQIAVKLRERKRKCNIQQGRVSKVKTDTRLRRIETSKQKSQSLEESSIATTICKQNESEQTSLSGIKQGEEEGHLQQSVTENTYQEVHNTAELKLAAKLGQRKLKCQSRQMHGSKFKTPTRQRRKENSKKNSQPKEESGITSADEKQSDPEYASLSAIKDDEETLKTVKTRKRKPNSSYHKKESVHCNICQYTFKLKGKYERHLADDKCRHDCKFCGKVFLAGQTYKYKDHLMTHQNVNDVENSGPDFSSKAFLCNTCGLGFDDQKRLKRHMTRSHRKYECSKCTKVLTSSNGLAYHFKRYHTTDTDHFWPCKICGKLFSERYVMANHEATHGIDKHFKCDKCPAAFTRELYLKEHQRRHAKDYSHICSDCGAGFYTKKELGIHQAKHTGVKSYCCSVCGAMLSHRSSFRKHMAKHSGVKKYVCKECDAGFFYPTSLRRHMAKHSGVKKFVCKDCGATFMYDGSLHRHMKKHKRDVQESKTEQFPPILTQT